MLEITKIRIKYVDNENLKLKARFSITFNNAFTINNAVVVVDEEKNMKFIAFHSVKLIDGKYRDLSHPITIECKNMISDKVLEMFDKREEEYINNNATQECKITNCKCRIINREEGIFETDLLIDDVFAINKIVCQIKDNMLSFKYPHFKMIDDVQILSAEFDSTSFRKDMASWIVKVYKKTISANREIKGKTPEERRAISNEKIKALGIACYENLPTIEASTSVKLKSLDEICKRAICALVSTQIACDINNGNYEESMKIFPEILARFGDAKEKLNSKEKRLFDGNYTRQDAIDIDWEYETYWAIVWALGLINDDISDASSICDCTKAIALVSNSKNLDDFKSKCRVRNIEQILDMLDLYYRYHWATTEKRINPDTPIGNLNSSVVVERRRGLEWLISDEEDWYDISLNT